MESREAVAVEARAAQAGALGGATQGSPKGRLEDVQSCLVGCECQTEDVGLA